jgi:hypothetical protein
MSYFPFIGGLNGDPFLDESDLDYIGDDYPRYARGHQQSTNIQCRQCGYDQLMWAKINTRWRLVYSGGDLKGKLHGCE